MRKGGQFLTLSAKQDAANNDDGGDNKLGGGMIRKRL